jgi:hypothetical protein
MYDLLTSSIINVAKESLWRQSKQILLHETPMFRGKL